MYAYDVMPRALSAGIWRDVTLEILDPTHFRSVYWTTLKTDAKNRTAEVLLDWDFVTERLNVDDLRVRVTLRRSDQITYQSEYPVLATHGRLQMALTNVDLCWLVDQIPQAHKPEMWLIDWQLSDGSKFRSHYLAAVPPVRLEDYRRWMAKLRLPPEASWVKYGIDGKE